MNRNKPREPSILDEGNNDFGQAALGIVLIHGIGNIEPGDMASHFAEGLAVTSGVYPEGLKYKTRLLLDMINTYIQN